MNLSTIVYLGKPELGNGRTVRQFLQNMEDGDNPALWAWYIHCGIDRERKTGKIDQPDETQTIVERMNEIMQRRAKTKDVFVGALDNRQVGLIPPDNLVNYIFHKEEDLTAMWEWIRDHFLPALRFDYDWFALLRYLADNNKLAKGIGTSNTKFAQQMKEWFPSYSCNPNSVKLYRTGYLGNMTYHAWNKATFSLQKKAGQTLDGYIHLEDIIYRYLSVSTVEDY